MTYAIIEIGGKQLWIEPGKFYDINKLHVLPGEIVALNKVLFVNRNGSIVVGNPCIERFIVKAKVLRHIKSRKLTVFKMKPKKNTKSKRGSRQDLTRLLIQEI